MYPNQIIKHVARYMAASVRFMPCFYGPPGCGKTDVAKQLAHAVCKLLRVDEKDCLFLVMYPGLDAPEDYKGMPAVVSMDGAEFLPFGTLKKLLKTKRYIFVLIDELDKGMMSTKCAVAQFIESRLVNGNEIGENVRFILAMNPKSSSSGGSPIPAHLNNRVCLLEYHPHVPDWIRWATNNGVTAEGIHFVKSNPKIITGFDESLARKGEQQSSARSYTRVDQIMYQNGLFDEVDNASTDAEEALAEQLVVEQVAGYLGKSDAMDYVTFMRLRKHIPKFDRIVQDPLGTTIPVDPDVQFILTSRLASAVQEQWIDPIVKYVSRIGDEMLANWAAELDVRNPDIKKTPAYTKLLLSRREIFGVNAA